MTTFGFRVLANNDVNREKADKTLLNIAALIPADALGLYIAAANIAGKDLLSAWLATLLPLGFALLIRRIAKAPWLLIGLTILSYGLYAWGSGNGIFEIYKLEVGQVGGVLLLVYGTVIAWLINKGIIKT